MTIFFADLVDSTVLSTRVEPETYRLLVGRYREQAMRRFGIEISVRVGVHRGPVYLDTAQGDVYGLAANLAARVSSLATQGAVVVSDAVEMLINNDFELEACAAVLVKGVEKPVVHYRIVAGSR